jgi:hypothetical protein
MRSTDALAALLDQPGDVVRLRTARVDSYTSTAATITLAGGSLSGVPYLASYTPAVGNTVLLLATKDGRLLIIGRVA